MSDNVLGDLSNIDLMVELELGEREKIEASCSFKHYDEQEQIIDRQSETTDVILSFRRQSGSSITLFPDAKLPSMT